MMYSYSVREGETLQQDDDTGNQHKESWKRYDRYFFSEWAAGRWRKLSDSEVNAVSTELTENFI